MVPASYPALRRAQQALTDWWSGPTGAMGRPGIVSHGIGMAADGLGLSFHVTLHTDATDADVARIEAAVASIATQHGVPIRINELRANYSFAPALGEPTPLPAPKVIDSPAPAPPTFPSILSQSTVSRRATLSTRKFPVRLRVAEGGTLRVTVRTADRRRTVVARGSAAPKNAGRLTVRTTLTEAGRTLLRKTRRSPVTITVKQTGQKTVTRRLVVR